MVQKYVENPMIIMNRKYDIRVWVVIPSWNPLRIFIWRNCYFRFACYDYDPSSYQNKFSHLTNNSVVKQCIERADNRRMLNKIPGNMWSLDQFRSYLNRREERRGDKSAASNRSHSVRDIQSSPYRNSPHSQTFEHSSNQSPQRHASELRQSQNESQSKSDAKSLKSLDQ